MSTQITSNQIEIAYVYKKSNQLELYNDVELIVEYVYFSMRESPMTSARET